MADLRACPNCGRRAKKTLSSNWFSVSTCTKCRKKYCNDCGGKKCPSCGSTGRSDLDKVYA